MLWEQCNNRVRILEGDNSSPRHTPHHKPLHMLHMTNTESKTCSFRHLPFWELPLPQMSLARSRRVGDSTRWHWKPCGKGNFSAILGFRRHLALLSAFSWKVWLWDWHRQPPLFLLYNKYTKPDSKIQYHRVLLNGLVFPLLSCNTFGKEFNMQCAYQFWVLAKNI